MKSAGWTIAAITICVSLLAALRPAPRDVSNESRLQAKIRQLEGRLRSTEMPVAEPAIETHPSSAPTVAAPEAAQTLADLAGADLDKVHLALRTIHSSKDAGLIAKAAAWMVRSIEPWLVARGLELIASHRIVDLAPAVVALVRGKSHDLLKARAAGALAEVGDAASVAPLEEMFRTCSNLARPEAALALNRLGRPEFLATLMLDASRRLAMDPLAVNRTMALDQLTRTGKPEALPSVRQALQDPDSTVRTQAAWALGELGESHDCGLLQGLLTDSSNDVHVAAQRSLDRIAARSK